jgi:radical SAM superfamily enzyme YgiQ (UPF0313 family)
MGVGEINPLFKRWRKGDKRVALIYPNRYAGGISNIGLQYIYYRINSIYGLVCERFYTDVFGGIRSLETRSHLRDFDMALFSIQYEEDIFNAYEILKKSGFRGLKIAGGPCIMENPVVYRLFDILFVGELEASDLIERLLVGGFEAERVEGAEGVYSWREDRVKRVYSDLDSHLETQIIGNGAYGKALLLEIGRGCYRNCRFCIVKSIYSPCRWRDEELLLGVAENYAGGEVDKIALISPSPSDHPKFKEIVFKLSELGFTVSPSSLRADKLDDELMELFSSFGLRTLTVAPEAGSEILRKVVNKGIREEDVVNSILLAERYGIEKMKFYFMIGLPGETDEDLEDILEMAMYAKRHLKRVEVSVNPLVPKPHTPFQWLAFGGKEKFDVRVIKELKEKIRVLGREFRKGGIEFEAPKVEDFVIQTVLSRGGREVFELVERGRKRAFRSIFDMGLEKYLDSFEDEYEDFPWSVVDHGYNTKRLRREYERALRLVE